MLRHTKAMFKFATEEGVIKKSPFLYVKINDTGSTKCRRILTNTEIEHLFTIARTTDYQFYLMLCTLLFTGIRVGELCGLKWNDFNEDFSSIRIDESLTNKKFENTTKTRYSMRVVPLTELPTMKHKWSISGQNHVFVILHKRKNRIAKPLMRDNFKNAYLSIIKRHLSYLD